MGSKSSVCFTDSIQFRCSNQCHSTLIGSKPSICFTGWLNHWQFWCSKQTINLFCGKEAIRIRWAANLQFVSQAPQFNRVCDTAIKTSVCLVQRGRKQNVCCFALSTKPFKWKNEPAWSCSNNKYVLNRKDKYWLWYCPTHNKIMKPVIRPKNPKH